MIVSFLHIHSAMTTNNVSEVPMTSDDISSRSANQVYKQRRCFLVQLVFLVHFMCVGCNFYYIRKGSKDKDYCIGEIINGFIENHSDGRFLIEVTTE